MYDRKTNNQIITLQVSGMLWQRSLVMRDLETRSLWSHLLGKAMQGKLKGAQLKILPATMSTWSEWKTRHPKTTVLALPRTSQKFRDTIWKKPQQLVYGIHPATGNPATAVSIHLLQKNQFSEITTNKTSILITYSKNGHRTQAFNRTLNGKILRFTAEHNGQLKDTLTHSFWEPVTGKCIKGKLTGKQLIPIPGTISYRKAWQAFFPDAKIIE